MIKKKVKSNKGEIIKVCERAGKKPLKYLGTDFNANHCSN